MKTTVEIPDKLMRAAKAMAARRGTTLKAILTHALERELSEPGKPSQSVFEVDGEGLAYLPRRGVRVTSELVNRLLEEE